MQTFITTAGGTAGISPIIFFLGLPIPIVAVSVGLSYDKYGIKDNNNNETIS